SVGTTKANEALSQAPRRAEASRPGEEVSSRKSAEPEVAGTPVESTERVPLHTDAAPEPTMALSHLPHRDDRRNVEPGEAADAAPAPTLALPQRDDRPDATLAGDAAPEPTMALPHLPRRDDRPDATLAGDAAPEPTMALP